MPERIERRLIAAAPPCARASDSASSSSRFIWPMPCSAEIDAARRDDEVVDEAGDDRRVLGVPAVAVDACGRADVEMDVAVAQMTEAEASRSGKARLGRGAPPRS